MPLQLIFPFSLQLKLTCEALPLIKTQLAASLMKPGRFARLQNFNAKTRHNGDRIRTETLPYNPV